MRHMNEADVGALAEYAVEGYRMPVDMREADIAIFETDGIPLRHTCSLRKFENLIVLGSGILMTHAGEVLGASVNSWTSDGVSESMQRRARRESWATRWLRKNYGKAAVPADRSTRGYYHWLVEGLPKLFLLQEQGWSDPVVMPDEYRLLKFARQSLELFGDLKIEFLPRYGGARIRQAFLIDDLSPMGKGIVTQNGPVLRRMADEMKRCCGAGKSGGGERIYISRGKGRRTLANEAEVLPILQRHGFRRVVLEEHDLREQIRILSAASVVLGPHGAGLSNVIFMPAGGLVIELRHAGVGNIAFYRLSEAMGHDYRYMMGEPVADAKDRGNVHNSDIFIQPEDLIAVLESI